MSRTSPQHALDQIRANLSEIAAQVSPAAEGDLEISVCTESDERSVQQLEMLFNRLLDTSRGRVSEAEETLRYVTDAVLTVDERGTVTSFNPRAEEIFGYASSEMIGRPARLLLPVPDREEYEDRVRDARCADAAAPPGVESEVIGRHCDGTTLPIILRTIEISRRPWRVLVLVRDLTAEKRTAEEHRELQAQLSESRRLEALGRLAAGIAHEINTPTQFVRDNIRFLQESFPPVMAALQEAREIAGVLFHGGDPIEAAARLREVLYESHIDFLIEEVPPAIEHSLEGTDRIVRIVRSMKEFSHPGAKEMSPFDLNKAIESTVLLASNEWKYVADLELKLDPDLPLVTGFAGEICQVILNLLINASHAIADAVEAGLRKKGVVRIATASLGEEVEIRIEDTGRGIPREIQDQVFDAFFTTKEIGKGTGQGLAMARSIVVEKHGGTLDFESEPGEGTVFTLRIPWTPASPMEETA